MSLQSDTMNDVHIVISHDNYDKFLSFVSRNLVACITLHRPLVST